MKPLNPTLYDLLKARFGNVKISNQGVSQHGVYRPRDNRPRDNRQCDRKGKKQWYLDLTEPGEYYQVCCPLCGDSSFRLYINHTWGKQDEEGHRNLWLMICYNENCYADADRRLELYEELNEPGGPNLARAQIEPGEEIDPNEIELDWPGPVTRVDQLPDSHKAVQYLVSRHFDPERVGRFYNVHYCHTSFRWLASDRLIIPVYMDKKFMGWQARYIGEMKWNKPGAPPKYYTCPGTPRRLLVYNVGNAAQYQTGVIMEGPTDVWSFGPMGVCTLGSTMTHQQQRRFLRAFKDHSAVLCYDPDVQKDPKKWNGVEKLIRKLDGHFAKGFAVVWLPEGRDPGSMDREFLRDYVYDEARKQGVKVSWRKR